MLSRVTKLFRFCNYAAERAERIKVQQKIKNDRYRVLKNYRYNVSNRRITLDNFKQYKDDPIYLDRCQIETRIMKRLYDSELVELRKFSFDQDMRNDLKLDSLNIVVLLTQIQHQFTTVFEDKVFESVRKLSQIVDILVRDEKVF